MIAKEASILVDEISRAEARFRIALEAAPNAMIMVDEAGKIVLVNRQAEQLFGYLRDELIGKPIELLVPDAFRAAHPGHRAAFMRDPKTRAMGAGRDLTARRKDGREVPVEIGLNPFETELGPHVMASVVDITERRRAAAALETRSADLARSIRDLETILYVATHDLKEPLNAILSFARLLTERCAGQLDERGREYVDRITGGASRLGRLLEDLLVLTKAQHIDAPAERVEATEVVGEALARFRDRIAETGARVRVAENLPRLRVHRTWGVELVANLLSNALKFAEPSSPPEIEIDRYEGPEGIGIVVRDRGIGVPEEIRERIFQLFQRGVGRDVEGTGAGLAIVRQIAERHGGKAWMAPRPGGGSEFFATFGRAEGERRPLDILLVDDDDDFTFMMREDLEGAGVIKEMHVARDGVEAMNCLRRLDGFRHAATPDLVLLDINMPRKNGFEVLAEMRADPDLRKIPVAIVTSSSRKEDEARAVAAGANAFLSKPFTVQNLLDVMDRILP